MSGGAPILEPGVVIIHKDGEEKVAAVHAGFAEILGEKVTLLVHAGMTKQLILF